MDDIFQSYNTYLEISEINNEPLNSTCDLDIQKYKIKDDFNCEVIEKETNKQYNIEFCKKEINSFLRYEIINFARSVNIMSRLNHPSIIKFIGYSPIDFNYQSKPVIITEDFSLTTNPENYTQKLIRIYGIASGMAYLHSHNILHRNLKPTNIFVDNKDLPKIYGFNIAKEITSHLVKPNKTIKGPPIYIAPEVYLNKGYSKKSDVYAFSLIVYEIITGEKPYRELISPKEIKNKVAIENQRPEFETTINKCYRDLIEKCWSSDPNLRPTFEEILTELKTNPEFITDTVDKNTFYNYVSYLDKYKVTFDENRKVKQLDDILQNRLHLFPDIRPSIHFNNMNQTEENNLLIEDDCFLNINDYKTIKYIKLGNFYNYNKVKNKITKCAYLNKETIARPVDFLRHDIINFTRELNILLQLNHPSILKFFGYALSNDEKPNILVEYLLNGSLGMILKYEQERSKIQKNQANKDNKNINGEEEDNRFDYRSEENEVKDENELINENEIKEENKHIDENDEENEVKDQNELIDENETKEENKHIDENDEENEVKDQNELINENEIKEENKHIDENDEENEVKDQNELIDENETKEENKHVDENDEEGNKDDYNEKEKEFNNENEEEEEDMDFWFGDYEYENNFNSEYDENDHHISLDETNKLIIIYGIVSGMIYLHSHNILHRDLKTDNIYLTDDLYPKISGFNIAKEISNKTINRNKRIKGTAVYAAPEVYLNKGYSKKSDVYAFSLIVYEIITGEKPYRELISPKEIKNKVAIENQRPEFETTINKCYRDLIEKCWSSDPNLRPTF